MQPSCRLPPRYRAAAGARTNRRPRRCRPHWLGPSLEDAIKEHIACAGDHPLPQRSPTRESCRAPSSRRRFSAFTCGQPHRSGDEAASAVRVHRAPPPRGWCAGCVSGRCCHDHAAGAEHCLHRRFQAPDDRDACRDSAPSRMIIFATDNARHAIPLRRQGIQNRNVDNAPCQSMRLPFPFSGNSSGNSLAVSHQVSFVRTVRTRGGSNGREDHEPGHLVCDPSHRLRPYVCTSSLKGSRELSHHPEIVLGMLIAVFCLNRIASLRGLPRQHQVPFIVPMCVPGRAVLTMPCGGILAVARRPSSLRPLVPVPDFIHSLNLPVAISNSRLISADASGVTFTYKDYRI